MQTVKLFRCAVFLALLLGSHSLLRAQTVQDPQFDGEFGLRVYDEINGTTLVSRLVRMSRLSEPCEIWRQTISVNGPGQGNGDANFWFHTDGQPFGNYPGEVPNVTTGWYYFTVFAEGGARCAPIHITSGNDFLVDFKNGVFTEVADFYNFDEVGATFDWNTPLCLDQLKEDGTRLEGSTIGRWSQSQGSFTALPVPAVQFVTSGLEVLQAQQTVATGATTEKYNQWKLDNISNGDIRNHRDFYFTDATKFTGQFKSVQSGIVLRNELFDAPGAAWGNLSFKDPWLIDLSDTYGLRNQGTAAPFKAVSSPFTPTTGSTYKGLFLNQPVSGSAPYYALRASQSSVINNFTCYLDSIAVSGAAVSPVSGDDYGVNFTSPSASVVMKYKAHLGSSFATASAEGGSQRRLVKDLAQNRLYLVYPSQNFIG